MFNSFTAFANVLLAIMPAMAIGVAAFVDVAHHA
jgi:hypothetical protein